LGGAAPGFRGGFGKLVRRDRAAACAFKPARQHYLIFMYVIIWEFTVRVEHVEQFVRAYGSNGDWASLFRLAPGFLGTQLLRSCHDAGVFLTVDRWENATCFEMFQERFAAEYKKLDARLEGYTLAERKVGVFEGEMPTL
jgi:heme-degrading monooxygenase HmoA